MLVFSLSYIIYFQFLGGKEHGYWLGISAQGIGVVGLIINILIATVVSFLTDPTPKEIQDLVENLRTPHS